MTTIIPTPAKTLSKSFHLPTKPLTLIDAINRTAAATGSFRYAMACTGADYNGHHVNTTRTVYGYYTAWYFWAGTYTIARGSFAEVAAAVKDWHTSQTARGTGATITVSGTEEEIAEGEKAALALGFLPEREVSDMVADPLKAEIHGAFAFEKWGTVPNAVSLLANSKTVEEYKAKVSAHIAERAAAAKAAREAAAKAAREAAEKAVAFEKLQDEFDDLMAQVAEFKAGR